MSRISTAIGGYYSRFKQLYSSEQRISESTIGFLLILLPLTLIFSLIVYPLLQNVFLSLTNQELLVPEYSIIGLDNYIRLVSDERFWAALENNVVYAGSTTILSVLFGLGIALLLNREFYGKGFVTASIIYPYLIPTVVVALAFRWILHDTYGVVNYILMMLGIFDSRFGWTSGAPMFTVVIASVWRFTPFVIILCLARLQTIPSSLYEAARVEGASTWEQFRYVTLPQLRLVLFIAVLLRFIWVFNMYDVIWLITKGGPRRATEHLPIYLYRTMFNSYNVGYAATIAMVMVIILLILTIIYFRFTGGYGGDNS